jgi:trypsin
MKVRIRKMALKRRGRLIACVVVALLVSLITLAAGGSPSHAVVGGSQVQVGAYRFMAYLTGTDQHNESYTCGGTLIDRDSVLTAAHCLAGAANVDVIVGATEVGVGQGIVRDGVAYAIPNKDSYPGPNGVGAPRYDVGVLQLNQPVTGIRPIHLATAKQNALEQEGKVATVAGWGKTTRGSGNAVDWLRKARITIKGDKYGEEAYNYKVPTKRYVPSIMIAAGTYKSGATRGDSGGPLFVKKRGRPPTQIGIVSWGDEKPVLCNLEPAYKCPGVYTEVNNGSIRKFITYAMKNTPGSIRKLNPYARSYAK